VGAVSHGPLLQVILDVEMRLSSAGNAHLLPLPCLVLLQFLLSLPVDLGQGCCCNSILIFFITGLLYPVEPVEGRSATNAAKWRSLLLLLLWNDVLLKNLDVILIIKAFVEIFFIIPSITAVDVVNADLILTCNPLCVTVFICISWRIRIGRAIIVIQKMLLLSLPHG